MIKNNKLLLGGVALFIVALAFFTFKSGPQDMKTSKTDPQSRDVQTTDSPTTGTATDNTNDDTNDSIFSDLPKPPAGFSWYECKNMSSYFLKPTGWYTKEESKSDTQGCFVTKEKIVGSGLFRTGLTVNAIPDIPSKKGVKASEFAEAVFENTKDKMRTSDEKVGKQGPFQVYSHIVYPEPQAGQEIVMYQMYAANDATGSLFVILYESPKEEWTDAWKMGKNIIANMAMNGEF